LPDGPRRIASGLAELPEIREVLETHLDPTHDPSLAIRAVYGQWLPRIVLLDRGWTSAQLSRIFPPEQPELRDVAWETYTVFCPPYDNVFEVLESEYAAAVGRLGRPVGGDRRVADPEECLAEHLMLLYGRGKLGADPLRGLVERFFEEAPGRIRGRAIQFIGRSLRENKTKIPVAVIRRFVARWEHRIAQARFSSAESIEELSDFGWWFVSQKFDEAWAMERLEEALRLAGAESHCVH
jgi:hypothetical protein